MKKNAENSSIETTAAIIGATTGATIGTVVAGPLGTIGGAAVGAALEKALVNLGNDIKARKLSKNENRRIGTVYSLAREKIKANLKAGKAVNDAYLSQSTSDRSDFDELTEEILFAAQRESEEKKIPYLSKLYANALFDKRVDQATAFQLIRIAEKLSFQQILILTTVGFFQIAGETIGKTPLKTTAYNTISDVRRMSIAVDTYSLYREGPLQSSSVVFDPPGITPANLSVRGLGALLYDLMELSTLPLENRIEDIVDYLTDGNYSRQIMPKNDA